jgi:multiple sugar transport system ATP-binding protein
VYPNGFRALQKLDLEIHDGEFMVFVGPSGCGKTTALRLVAGLEEISEGEIRIDDKVVNGLEPRKRDIAMIFQNYSLYPHMTVFDNIAFPLRSQRASKADVQAKVERTANRLGISQLLHRTPKTLSGGQRQRVAMGRAIVRQPRVFLMDEPLSNLDAKLRVQMRAEISQIQRELRTTTIYVTHDQVEALTMGTRIAVMRRGVLQQEGPPQEVYERPVNLFVATFLGSPPMNLFKASVEQIAGRLYCIVGEHRLEVPAAVVKAHAGLDGYVGRQVAVGIRPEHLADPAYRAGSARLTGQVDLVEALGSERLVHFRLAADPVVTEEILEVAQDVDAAVAEALQAESSAHRAALVARVDIRSAMHAGEEVEVVMDSDHLYFFSLETGAALR